MREERELLKAARCGSPDAIEALVELHWVTAHRIAFAVLGDRHAAEDVAQESILSVIGSLGRFDVYRPLGPWLHRIVSNRALDWIRTASARKEWSIEHIPETPSEDSSPQSTDEDLAAALKKLPPDQRVIVGLRYLAGYGTNEISKLLDLPRGTVGSRLRRALDHLRSELEDGGT